MPKGFSCCVRKIHHIAAVSQSGGDVGIVDLLVVTQGGSATFTGFLSGFVIHTETVANDFLPRGVLEELVIHESVHGSLDAIYLDATQWLQAQQSDIRFVTEYARDFPQSEDLAESYGAYLIVKNASCNPASPVEHIEEGIPAGLHSSKALASEPPVTSCWWSLRRSGHGLNAI